MMKNFRKKYSKSSYFPLFNMINKAISDRCIYNFSSNKQTIAFHEKNQFISKAESYHSDNTAVTQSILFPLIDSCLNRSHSDCRNLDSKKKELFLHKLAVENLFQSLHMNLVISIAFSTPCASQYLPARTLDRKYAATKYIRLISMLYFF